MASSTRTDEGGRHHETRARKAPAREKGQRTRQRIIHAAEHVFTRDGYLNARVTDIAQRARVAHGSFYTYFDSKDDVFRWLAHEVHEDMRDAIVDAGAADRIEHANLIYIDAYERNAVILGLIEQAATFDEHYRELRSDLRARLVATLERVVIRTRGATGQPAPLMDPRTVASVLAAMVEGFAYTWFVLDEKFDRAMALATLNTVCVRTLGLEDEPERT